MMTAVVQPHFLYKNYGSTKDGSVYNYHNGRKMAVGTRYKFILLYVNGQTIHMSHKLFVWQCFNGVFLPSGLEVIFDDEINGNFCDKLIAVNADEKKTFNIRKIEKNRQQMVTAGFFPHPQCPNYVANEEGKVYSLYTNKELIGNLHVNGYCKLTMLNDIGTKIVKSKHTIVWESNTGTLVPTGYQIDHLDQNKTHNAFKNLQCISRRDHVIKTNSENTHIIKAFAAGSNRKVIRTCIQNDTVVEFSSRKDAAESVFGKARAVGDAIRSKSPYLGFLWSNVTDPNLPNEKWYQGEITKYCVSNLGRIWPKCGYKTFGYKRPTGYTTQLNGSIYGVHVIICHAFHGPRPGPQYTVDHKDNNVYNNHYENLRYATKQEQAINRRSVKPVEGYIRNTGKIVGIWPTITEAAAATGANIGSISSVLKGRRKSSGKSLIGEPIAWRLNA